MKAPSKMQASLTLVITVLSAVSGFLGYDKYEQVQAAAAVATPVSITFEADALGGDNHPHPYASSTHEHQQLIKSIAREAVNRQHGKDLLLFKQKEDWE